MIFLGYNLDIVFPRYDHHSKWTDSRCVPSFALRYWNRLKYRQPAYQMLEWFMSYGKPYCEKCMEMFIEDEGFFQYDGIVYPTREDRIKIVNRLKGRFK